MYMLASQFTNLDVISLQTGQVVAKLQDLILKPDSLEVMAFSCDYPELKKALAVILPQDIRQIAHNCIIIDATDEIQDAHEIIRLRPITESPFKLSGFSVVTEGNTKLGRIEDYTINIETYRVQKLYVQPALLRSFLSGSLIIDRGQIVDVTPKHIIVREMTVKEPMVAPVQPVLPGE